MKAVAPSEKQAKRASEPKQEPGTADLFAPLRSDLVIRLERDAEAPTRPLTSPKRQPSSNRRLYLVGLGVVGAVVGAVLGALIGSSLYTPDPNAWVDFGGLDYAFTGGLAGLLVGAIALPLILSPWLGRTDRKTSR
jgi:hypothetical protein